jgi:hypothetical protein
MNRLYTAVFACFLLLSPSVAQQKNIPAIQPTEKSVEVTSSAGLTIKQAKLIAPTRNPEEGFALSFQSSNGSGTTLNQSQVILTAHNLDGTVYGRQIWSTMSNATTDKTANGILVTLRTNPRLDGANRYTLDVEPPALRSEGSALGIDCESCVVFAQSACGSAGIHSVTCGGSDGTCTFTCRTTRGN